MLAFGFIRNCGLVSAEFVRRIAYLLYGDIRFGVLSKPIALSCGVKDEVVIVQKRQRSGLLRYPRYPRHVLDGRFVCMYV